MLNEGMKNAIGEMRGMFFPKHPILDQGAHLSDPDPLLDEEWFMRTMKDKVASHPENKMEYPFFDEPIFNEPLVGFIRGNDPIFDQLKEVIGPRGLCATGVPCASEIPKPIQRNAE